MSSNVRLNNATEQSTELTSSETRNREDNKQKRAYHSWQGNNTICCDGRVIGGPQKRNYVYTLTLIVVPSITFTCFVCRNFIKEYSAYYVLFVYVILLTISLISLTMTAFSDPGIIPRGILPSHFPYKGPQHLKQRLCISGKIMEIKWCGTCHVFRPPRSFHCYICNNCVERFDHHCPWIGNCIGIRNYAYFSIFVNSLQLVCFWALAHCIKILYLRARLDIISHNTSWKQFAHALRYEPMAFATGIYVFIGMWFVIGLTWFHWFLVFVGKTTNEQLRNLHPAGSPFKRTLLGNIMDHCCQFPATSVHLHHIAPTTSYNELYVNKQKVVLLDNDGVKKHHETTHCTHIRENSPFKACLVKNFGYKDVVKQSISKAHMITNKLNVNDNKYQNGKNGYETHIQMYHIKNGHSNIQNEGKIEEEEEDNFIIEPNDDTEEKHQIITSETDKNTKDKELQREEENKYDHIDDMDASYSNSKSISRNDENIDEECLYTVYDDDDDDDIQPLQRSVTPVIGLQNDAPSPIPQTNRNAIITTIPFQTSIPLGTVPSPGFIID